ncbi:MAG: hypothetical protein ABRQ38_23695 [Candidatus Eremiobacterota bacterium]
MTINTSYNTVNTNMPVNTAKAKDSGSSDKVVLGGETSDNTIAMTDQLKNMKAGSTASAILSYKMGPVEVAAVGGVVGIVGTAFAENILGGFGMIGNIGFALFGGAVGALAGLLIAENG